MSRALYRTYRSRSFDEVVGQPHVTTLLKNAISSSKIAHAYLLTGPRGVGKTSVARIIAHSVNGLEYSEDPHLDIIEIDAASNRRIDDIRDLREKVHILPITARYKVYIVDEVHMLTSESFNALLKTLEEPPEHVIFILATTEVHKVPATIISRTQRFHFRPASTADLKKHLASIAKKEKIAFERAALELIAQHAGGSFRDSISLLDQLSGLAETITAGLVESVLGMAEAARIEALVEALEAYDVAALVKQLEAIHSTGVSPIILTDQLARTLSDRAKTNHHLYQLLDALTDVPRAHDPQLKLIATLVRFAEKPAPDKTVASHSQTPPSLAAKPATLRSQAAKRMSDFHATIKQGGEKTAKKEPVGTNASTTSKNQPFEWNEVLRIVKKHHPALYSVLSRAKIDFSLERNTLTLTFAYVIHRKKLENSVYRKQLSTVIDHLYRLHPEIIVTDTKTAIAYDSDVKAIAAIMGGGEPVSGAI